MLELVGDKFVNVDVGSSKVKCEICGKEFKNLNSISRHLPIHKISSKEYYDLYIGKPNKCIVRDCDKDPNSGHNSKECREKMSIATQARWDDPDNFFNSQELRDRRREYMKEIWEDPECFWRSDKFLDQVIPKRKEYMLNGGASYANSFITNPSKPQVELFKIAKSLYDTSVLNYSSLNFSIDIAIPDLNIAIEYDGSYWHKGREEADAKRQKLLENEGWKFLRYVDYVPSSEELKKDIKQIILKEIN